MADEKICYNTLRMIQLWLVYSHEPIREFNITRTFLHSFLHNFMQLQGLSTTPINIFDPNHVKKYKQCGVACFIFGTFTLQLDADCFYNRSQHYSIAKQWQAMRKFFSKNYGLALMRQFLGFLHVKKQQEPFIVQLQQQDYISSNPYCVALDFQMCILTYFASYCIKGSVGEVAALVEQTTFLETVLQLLETFANVEEIVAALLGTCNVHDEAVKVACNKTSLVTVASICMASILENVIERSDETNMFEVLNWNLFQQVQRSGILKWYKNAHGKCVKAMNQQEDKECMLTQTMINGLYQSVNRVVQLEERVITYQPKARIACDIIIQFKK